MAFTIKGPIVAGARETTGAQAVTLLTGYATGDVIVVWAATKATGVTGDQTEVTVTDSKGNAYVRAAEHAFGGTTGGRASVHYANVTAALVSGDTVTLGINSGLSQHQAMAAVGFTGLGGGNKASHVAASGNVSATGTTIVSGGVAGLTPGDYLFLATVANRNSTVPANITGDATESWALTGAASTTGTTGGTTASGLHVNWNYKAVSASGAVRNASGLIAGGARAIVVVALQEQVGSVAHSGEATFGGNSTLSAQADKRKQGEATFGGAGSESAQSRQVHFIKRQLYSLLLHGDSTITDEGNNAHTVTAVGSAAVDGTQSKFGGASIGLNGTTDYLRLDGHDDFSFGGGDFTIDMWVRLDTITAAHVLYDSRPAATEGAYHTLYANASGLLRYIANGAERITGTAALAADTWNHVALTRKDGVTRLFVNGTQDGSNYTDANVYLTAANRPIIGADAKAPDSNFVDGWLDEIRVVKGWAAWSANFTSPSAAYTTPPIEAGQPFAGAGSLSALAVMGEQSRAIVSWAQASFTPGAAAPTVWQGQATFNGAGSLSINATLRAQIAATFNGNSTLSVEAQHRKVAFATFNGDGTLSVLAQIRHAAAATFNGNSTLSVEAQKRKLAEATFNGDSTLSVQAQHRKVAFATFNGDSTLSAYANLRMLAFATFSGDGVLSVDAVKPAAGVHQGQATFNGEGTLSAKVEKFIFATFNGNSTLSVNTISRQQAAATFNGNSTLSAYANLRMRAFATFAGDGILRVEAAPSNVKFGEATFNGSGSLSVQAQTYKFGEARFEGNSTLEVHARQNMRAFATLPGAGSLSVETQKSKLAAATFQGNSTLSVATQKSKLAEATFNGNSTLSVATRQLHRAFATFNGDSTLSAYANLRMRIAATFQGEGNFSIFIEAPNVKTGQATFNGAGSLSAETRHFKAALATFDGNSSLQVTARLRQAAFATLDGLGSLTVSLRQNSRAFATFNGDGTLSALGVQRIQIAARFAGAGDFSVLVTQGDRAAITMAGSGSLQTDAEIFVFGTKIGEAIFGGEGAMACNVLQFGPRRTKSTGVAYTQGNRTNVAQGGRSNVAQTGRPTYGPRRRTG